MGLPRKVGSRVDLLYPKHGKMNVLCTRQGELIATGKGPNGPYIDVRTDDGQYRRLSENKIVVRLGNGS